MVRQVPHGSGRDLLVATTVGIVAEKGLRGMTFRAVAERAGVNNSLIAHHFGDRESLLAAALDWSVERSIETTGLLDLATSGAFADGLLDSVADRPELQAFQYEMILESRRNPRYKPYVSRLYTRYNEVVQASLSEHGIDDPSGAIARSAFATLDGVVLQFMAGVDPELLRAALHNLWQGLLGDDTRVQPGALATDEQPHSSNDVGLLTET
ncbi:TetR/AcrR family transcriptional regulator [Microbacterium foliorum]|uniref:HTH-type transcriptional regulator BetI n=1 Tax=Microbacterium foliorum TaxID=104336 RepID=A0A0F0KL25_9MICO|nr:MULTISPECIES: TetR family transcriptional regulator [Microbacterium]AXL13175.1 TetR/AcrR family transcriptional regulator [Microbacterium foliorum]KJL21139.1 HTH-type transcriptional regulator BetI [Microbacterium foliorum]